MKKVKIIAVVILMVLVSGASVYITTRYFEAHPKTVEVLKEVEKEVVISGKTIESGLNNIGKLSTAEYYYTHVESFDDSKKIKDFSIPFTNSKFIYSYDGTVCAGIDFTQIEIEKNDNNKKITVVLPAVEIISSEVDQDSFKLYDEKNSIFNQYSVSDVAISLVQLKTIEEENAIKKGLFNRAKENAESLVKNFLKGSYNIEDYEIEVKFKQS